MNVEDTKHIVAQLRGGEHAAYEAVFRAWYTPLCAYACSMLRNADEAEEEVQKMFCTLYDKRAQLHVQRSLKAYLYRAVHNRCLNRIKHRGVRAAHRSELRHLGHEAHHGAHSRVEHHELERALRRAVEQLPAQCRRVFELSRVQQRSYQAIAKQLHISPNTVENHMAKALRLLRQSLKEFLPMIAYLILTKL